MKHSIASPSPTPPEALFRALLRVWGLLRQVQEPYFAGFGISPSQWGILRVLERAERNGEAELPLKEISQRMLVQPPSVTGVVDRLERQGLVTRASSSRDLRVRHLRLTEKGRKLMAKVLEGHPEKIASLIAPLQPGEQKVMLQLLQRLEFHLETLAAGAAPNPSTPESRHERDYGFAK